MEDTEIPQKGKYPPLHALILYKNIETSKHKCLLWEIKTEQQKNKIRESPQDSQLAEDRQSSH